MYFFHYCFVLYFYLFVVLFLVIFIFIFFHFNCVRCLYFLLHLSLWKWINVCFLSVLIVINSAYEARGSDSESLLVTWTNGMARTPGSERSDGSASKRRTAATVGARGASASHSRSRRCAWTTSPAGIERSMHPLRERKLRLLNCFALSKDVA